MEFVHKSFADQHLTQDGDIPGRTLCGMDYRVMPPHKKVYDHRDGFDPKWGRACETCADEADRIQNGRA